MVSRDKMSYSPGEWLIQDLDNNMMYPPQTPQTKILTSYQYTDIKQENTMESCAFNNPASCGPRSLPGLNVYNNQYAGHPDTAMDGQGEWGLPSDLASIVLDENLPGDCESPLKLEDFNYQFVDPSTLEPPVSQGISMPFHNSVVSTPPMKFSNTQCALMPQNSPGQFYDSSTTVVAMESLPNVPAVQSRLPGSRGRPRAEWRITNTRVKRCVGRPRTKGRVGRPPNDSVHIKTELLQDEDEYGENIYPDLDPCEEKRERRREQNRRAARKLREKKKVHVEAMKSDYDNILCENRRLTSEVTELRRLVQQLKEAKSSHVCQMCSEPYTPSPATSGYISNTTPEPRDGMTTLSHDLSMMER